MAVVVVVFAVLLFQGSHLSSVGGAQPGTVRDECSTNRNATATNYQDYSSPTSNRSITECKPHPCLRGTGRKREQIRWGKRGFCAGRQKRNVWSAFSYHSPRQQRHRLYVKEARRSTQRPRERSNQIRNQSHGRGSSAELWEMGSGPFKIGRE